MIAVFRIFEICAENGLSKKNYTFCSHQILSTVQYIYSRLKDTKQEHVTMQSLPQDPETQPKDYVYRPKNQNMQIVLYFFIPVIIIRGK